MRRFKGRMVSAPRCTFEFEMDDDATQEEIEQEADDCAHEFFSYEVKEVTKKKGKAK